jgi:hypothetical protein
MIIANPIYDVVFKYLMEDTEIAKGLLSTILKTDIVVKPKTARNHHHCLRRNPNRNRFAPRFCCRY